MRCWRDFLDPRNPPGRYLPWKEVARETGLSRTTAWRLQKRDDFPAPYAISPGRVGYREDEVQAWRISRDPSRPRRGQPFEALESAAASPVAAELPGRPPPRPPAPAAGAQASPGEDGRGAASSGDAAPATRISRKQRPRRRSEHAKAIAQQMLFDF